MATQLVVRPFVRCVLACTLPILILILPALAVPDNIITVCPAGPPQCDYNAIQSAIDAVLSGDTIIVAAGTYTGQLILKSQLTLNATNGPTNTIITASASPILSASNVSSLTLQGFGIQGQAAFTSPVGIDLVNSSIVLSNVIISQLRGSDGHIGAPGGTAVSGIRISGTSQLTLVNSRIENLVGGHGLDGSGMPGGDVGGLTAQGHGQLSLSHVAFYQLEGGGSGTRADNKSCHGRSGAAIGIKIDGDIALDMSDSSLADLSSGSPCNGINDWCVAEAGSAMGVQVTGGTATLQDNVISKISAPANISLEPVYAIRTSHTAATRIAHNIIAGPGFPTAQSPQPIPQTASFYCGQLLSMVGVASENDGIFQLTDTTITGIAGYGLSGYASAVTVHSANQVTMTHNTISGVRGGSDSSSTGIRVSESGDVNIAANRLDHIFGGDGMTFGGGYWVADHGSSATGIELAGVTRLSVVNNTVWRVGGGAGNYTLPGTGGAGGNGGNATGLRIWGNSPGSIWNNVIEQTIHGPAGSGRPGQPGVAIGMWLGGPEVVVVNNVIAQHDIGLMVISPTIVLAGANAFWANTADYSGVSSGLGDLHTNPWYVDAEHGDFHLSFLSPLIDAGFTLGAPTLDMDNHSRPYDGDDDGQSRTDIGADEFRPGALHKVYLPYLTSP